MQLVKWSDRNRYSFRLHDFGDEIALRVSVISDKADAPLPQTLSATLLLAGQSIGVPMAAVEGERGVFEGRFALPDGKLAPEEASASARKGAVAKGLLYLQEGGAGALVQSQAIPVALPYAVSRQGNRSEAASSGANLSGLTFLAEGNGRGRLIICLPCASRSGFFPCNQSRCTECFCFWLRSFLACPS